MKQPSKNYPSYVTQWGNAVQEAYQIAASNSSKSASQAKVQHENKAHSITLLPGDRVLVKNFEKGGPGKIRSYWEQTVYRVVKRLNDDAPVYTVEPENGNGKQRTLHRTLLLPCDSLPIDNLKVIPHERTVRSRT